MTLPEWNLVAPPEQRPMQPRWGLLSVICRTMRHSFHRIWLASATPLRCQATPYFGWDSMSQDLSGAHCTRSTIHSCEARAHPAPSLPLHMTDFTPPTNTTNGQHNDRIGHTCKASVRDTIARTPSNMQCNTSRTHAASRAEGRARYQPGLASPRQ